MRLKTLVLGLGNPILRDDGVGCRVVQALEGRLDGEGIALAESSAAGSSLLDLLVGYRKAIIVDAIQTQGGRVGKIYGLAPRDFAPPYPPASVHRVDLFTALELGRRLGLGVPQEVVILAVEAADVTTFSEECTPAVKRAIPRLAEMVMKEIGSAGGASPGKGGE